MNIIVTWMYCHQRGDITDYPNVKGKIDIPETQNYYWRCVFSLFDSSYRVNSDCRHLLFINQKPPSELDGININELIKRYGIELYEIKKCTRPPAGFYNAWTSQFTMLDILDELSDLVQEGNISADDICMLLDSDCIFYKPLPDDFLNHVRENRALPYWMDYPLEHEVNGNTITQLKQLASEYGVNITGPFRYVGGELICGLGSELKAISEVTRKTYDQSVERFKNNLRKFNTEEHLFSYVYHKLGYTSSSANKYIRRIWTDGSVYRNALESGRELIILHLPDQKKKGFVRYFREMGKTEIFPGELRRVFNIDRPFTRVIQQGLRFVVRKMYLAGKRTRLLLSS
ncbi:MAG: hypothetical protein WA666_11080 [Nitrospirota bacterium]